jgi:hypothetical protein
MRSLSPREVVPSRRFVAALIGVEALLRIDFDLTKGPVTFISQALDGLRQKLSRWRGDSLPAYGRPTGIVVNYSPDHAVHFDPNGKPIKILDRAYRFGIVQLAIGGRATSQADLAMLFGTTSVSAAPSEPHW